MKRAARKIARHIELFSLARWWGIVLKEFLQLKRDRITFAMIIGIPILQILLFGYAINSDPKHLPTAVIAADHSEFSRSFIAGLKNSDYFAISAEHLSEAEAQSALARGEIQFMVNIPADFSRRLVRGEHPALLVEADATDPMATGMALSALQQLAAAVAARDLKGVLNPQARQAAAFAPQDPFEIRIHRRYNPEADTHYNIIPGLMGVILTMTLVMLTGLAMTRERERGTMENLLATPVTPIEVMSGKIMPYIAIGLIQASIILIAARYLFNVPFAGSLPTLYLIILIFVTATLTVGITLSSIAQNQLQAVQLGFFYFLPSLLLSGFMFPFRGMPQWAQIIGEVLPLTHFNRLIRGILLKGNSWPELWPEIWPLLLFIAVAMGIAVKFYRRTLD
ncbi:MAG: ABC transporter permease [Betaproteobacteria bacterium]|nr:ABC transporter permease [Betaproteobacteria bacterium]